eukprot:4918527-Prymnesium_polylepis.1
MVDSASRYVLRSSASSVSGMTPAAPHNRCLLHYVPPGPDTGHHNKQNNVAAILLGVLHVLLSPAI